MGDQSEVKTTELGGFPALTELLLSLPDGATVETELDLNNDTVNSPDTPTDDSSLFIGDIARTLTDEQLQDLFSPFGEVVNVEIKRDKITKTSLGYAFVQFKTRQEAANAKKGLHKTVVASRPIRIGWAQKNTNLFVGDLDPSVSSEMLRDAFKVFGDIVEDETFAKNQNYGFVKFKRRIDAETAKREMDGRVLGGRRIRTGWGDTNTQRHCVHIQFDASTAIPSAQPPFDSSSPSAADSASLTNNATQIPGVLSETDLHTAFSPFGSILNVHLPRTASRLRGFGFVRYNDTDEGEASAEAAIGALHNTRIAGVLVSCNFGKKQTSKRRTSIPSATIPANILPPTLQDSGHSEPMSPKESSNHQLSRENAFPVVNSKGNDDHISKMNKVKNALKYNNGHRAAPKNKPRSLRNSQQPQHAFPPQRSHQSIQTQQNFQHNSQLNLFNHHNSQHSHEPQKTVYTVQIPQYTAHLPSPQHSPQSPHQHMRLPNINQSQPTLLDNQPHLSASLLPPMYHGPWITQRWVPYMVPPFYPQVSTHEDMHDSVDSTHNRNASYHHAPEDAIPPVYMYSYSDPLTLPFHQSYAYAYSSHGT